VGEAPLTQLVKQRSRKHTEQYRLAPLPMPRMEVRTIEATNRRTLGSRRGEYGINKDLSTSQTWAFETMFPDKKQRPASINIPADEVPRLLRHDDNPDFKTILWAPRWGILEELGLAQQIKSSFTETELFLLVDQEAKLPSTGSSLRRSHGRVAYIAKHRPVRDELIWQMVTDQGFMDQLERGIGIPDDMLPPADE